MGARSFRWFPPDGQDFSDSHPGPRPSASMRWSPPPQRILRNPEIPPDFGPPQNVLQNQPFRIPDREQYRDDFRQFYQPEEQNRNGNNWYFSERSPPGCFDFEKPPDTFFHNMDLPPNFGANQPFLTPCPENDFNNRFQGPPSNGFDHRRENYFNGPGLNNNGFDFNMQIPPQNCPIPAMIGNRFQNSFARPPRPPNPNLRACQPPVPRKMKRARRCSASAQNNTWVPTDTPKSNYERMNANMDENQNIQNSAYLSIMEAQKQKENNAIAVPQHQPQIGGNGQTHHFSVPSANNTNTAIAVTSNGNTAQNNNLKKRKREPNYGTLQDTSSNFFEDGMTFQIPSPYGPPAQKPRLSSSLARFPGLWFGEDMPRNPGIPNMPEKLYHYTTWEGIVGIFEDRYICLNERSITRYGFGIYFTDIPPERRTEDIVYNNYNNLKESKFCRTEYCFEFLSADLPELTFCKDNSWHYASSKGRKDRNVWKSSVHRLYLEGTRGTYYLRDLDGLKVPKSVEKFTWEFFSSCD